MGRLRLFYRLMLRPLLQEPVRAALTILAVALGVAVVLAIDLAGAAATGSFRTSIETLTGGNSLEVIAAGGVPESSVAIIATLPYAIRVSPRIEDSATFLESKQTLPLIGLDLIAQANSSQSSAPDTLHAGDLFASPRDALRDLQDPESIWVGASLKKKVGDRISLIIGDQVHTFTVRGVYPDSNGNESAVILDISAAQRVLHRFGRVDRILLHVPETPNLEKWQERLRAVLPPGVEVRPEGAGTEENRQMLSAFRWNLQLLSYIALIVGAFLIYNTISVSVVRRRPQTGIVRALGARRGTVLAAFIGEAAFFGLLGTALGLPLGRALASGAVKLMSATVESLYVSSRPGTVELSLRSVALAVAIGVGVAILSAYSPAREASFVPPVEAMARGRREYQARVQKTRDLWFALVLALAGAISAYAPAVKGKPLFGYLAAILLVLACALAIPAFTHAMIFRFSRSLRKIMGIEAFLASRSLFASLRRTSVLVGALATAIAMMVSVGIMVGSFRETVRIWMNGRLPADLYISPAGRPAPDRHPAISLELANAIARLPGVAWMDRLRAYEISYQGMPATLASVDLSSLRAEEHSNFLSGRRADAAFEQIRDTNGVLVSEPFSYKHHIRAGDVITLPLGAARPAFRVADIYYDYGSERGTILMDRQTMLRYLPDPAPSNLAVYVALNFSAESVRKEIVRASADYRVFISSNRDLRVEAIRIFDRTFAITYALEAIAVLVAVIGIAGALLALVIDRRRELSLLRFFGASAGQIRKQILVEAGILGLLANVAGLFLGLSLSLILIYVINKQSFGWTIRFHWPVAVLLVALGFVYLATVLAGFYPAQVAVRLNPLEAVHED